MNNRKLKHCGKIIKLDNYKEFSFQTGTVNIDPLKSFYLNIQSFLIIENKYKYQILDLIKKVKFDVKNYCKENLPKHNLFPQAIIIIEERTESYHMFIQKHKMFFELELTLFVNENFVYDKENSKKTIEKLAHEMTDIIISNDEFSFKR